MIAALEEEWRVLQPSSDTPESAELAVSPDARGRAHVYVLVDEEREEPLATPACALGSARWRARTSSHGSPAPTARPVIRRTAGSPLESDPRIEAVVETKRGQLRFRPGERGKEGPPRRALARDRRPRGARVDRDGTARSTARRTPTRSLACGRRSWHLHSGDVLVSLEEGFECVDWGQTSHVGGGSHGSLMAGDSLAPLLLVGLEPGAESTRDQWRITDVAGLVRAHFGLEDPARAESLNPAHAGAGA